MNPFDAAGLVGVVLMLAAYAGAQARRLDPVRWPALTMNLAGSALVMVSLTQRFNLAAFIMEAAWAAVALFGLVRLVFRRRRGD